MPWVDIQDYGAVPKPYSFNQPSAQVTVLAGSNVVTVAPGTFLNELKQGQGICIPKMGQPTQQIAPIPPALFCPAASGSLTLRYCTVGYDARGGLTAASPICTITGAALGPQRVAIKSISRDVNGILTIQTAAPHGFKLQYGGSAPGNGRNPTIVTVAGCMPYTINGRFMLSGMPTAFPNPTTIVCRTENTSESSGTVGADATVTVWSFVTVDCGLLSGSTIGHYVYSDSQNPGGPLQLIGKCLLGESHFTDWGPDLAAGYIAPSYVPTTPPSAPQNQLFTSVVTAIGSGTQVSLQDTPPASGTGTILFDDGVNLLQACYAAKGLAGLALISGPRTAMPGMQPGYIFNSPVVLPEWIDVIIACKMIVNETISYTASNEVDQRLGTTAPMQGIQFGQRTYTDIGGLANPIFLIGEDRGNSGGVELDGLGFTCYSNGQVAVQVRSAFYTKISNCAFMANSSFGTAVGVVYQGSCTLAKLDDCCFQFNNKFGQVPLNGPPTLPAVWLRASDNPNIPNGQTNTSMFLMSGKHTFYGRGILFDHLYAAQNSATTSIKIGEMIWAQANSTPMVMFWGQLFRGVDVAGVVNDTSQEAVIANWTTYELAYVRERNCYNNLQRLNTGNPINDLEVSACSNW